MSNNRCQLSVTSKSFSALKFSFSVQLFEFIPDDKTKKTEAHLFR